MWKNNFEVYGVRKVWCQLDGEGDTELQTDCSRRARVVVLTPQGSEQVRRIHLGCTAGHALPSCRTDGGRTSRSGEVSQLSTDAENEGPDGRLSGAGRVGTCYGRTYGPASASSQPSAPQLSATVAQNTSWNGALRVLCLRRSCASSPPGQPPSRSAR